MKRSEKTKQQLANHLKKLMETKPLDKISVQEVTERAELNRQTFYYHFDDIYDLLKWTLEREAIELLYDRQEESLWKEGLRDFLLYLEKNRVFAQNAVYSLGRDQFNRFFHRKVYEIIGNAIQQFAETFCDQDEKYLAFLTHYYTISFAATAISWLQGEIDYSVEEVIQLIDRLLQEHIKGAKVLNDQLTEVK